MHPLIEKFFAKSPNFVQELMVSFYNYKAYKKRYGGNYQKYFQQFQQAKNLTLAELQQIQFDKLKHFLHHAKTQSAFYAKVYQNIDVNSFQSVNDIQQLPVLDKETLRASINEVYTLPKSEGNVGKTGGTTGKSLEVVYVYDNTQERFAMLDNFRSGFGYHLGKKTAWFSGKHLLNAADLAKNRFWKTDHFYKVRYYSTFHIKTDYMRYYVENLIQFAPEFMVGFPSSMLEIARYGLKNGYDFPAHTIKAIFPTAETVTADTRHTLETFFKTKVYDQYASSEGAPFIFECKNNKLHLELQSGVFEVLDANNQPTESGKLVVTSFTTYGTPLIRYDIGDSIELSHETCDCGNHNPLVKQILGRIDDYIYSPENGKINLGNVSNTLKDTKGIVKFQAVQDALDAIVVKTVVDKTIFTPEIEKTFLKNWRDRVGNAMTIDIVYVEDIPVEASGKYRMVKNSIKHLIS